MGQAISRAIWRAGEFSEGEALRSRIVGTPQQFDKVTDYIRIGEGTPGMHGIACSKLPDDDRLKDGLFVRPVIFVGAPMTRVWLAKRFSDL